MHQLDKLVKLMEEMLLKLEEIKILLEAERCK